MTASFPGPLVLQGIEQRRIIAPFMYQVYINGLLTEISNHSFPVVINFNRLTPSSPSFGDDIPLVALYASFLQTFMEYCYDYSLKCWYEFNHTKSGTVTFGEGKQTHHTQMNKRECRLGLQNIDNYTNTRILGC